MVEFELLPLGQPCQQAWPVCLVRACVRVNLSPCKSKVGGTEKLAHEAVVKLGEQRSWRSRAQAGAKGAGAGPAAPRTRQPGAEMGL